MFIYYNSGDNIKNIQVWNPTSEILINSKKIWLSNIGFKIPMNKDNITKYIKKKPTEKLYRSTKAFILIGRPMDYTSF